MATDPLRRKIRLKNGRQIAPTELRHMVLGAVGNQQIGIHNIQLLELMIVHGSLADAQAIGDLISGAAAAEHTIAHYAVETNLISPDDLAKHLSRIHRVGHVDLTGMDIPEHLTGLLDVAHMARLHAVPISGDQTNLTVAVVDPSDASLPAELARLTGAGTVTLKVASGAQLDDAISAITRAADTSDQQLEQELDTEVTYNDLRAGSGESAVVTMANAIIAQARDQGASDIHIEPGPGPTRVRYRIDGVMSEVRTIPRTVHDNVITRIKVIAELKIDERRAPQDGRTTFQTPRGKVELRVATLPTVFGERVTMRLLDPGQSKLGLSQLGLKGDNLTKVNDAVMRPHGLCITTGPTGSGKSTTLYAMMHLLNDTIRNIITVEDPVEQQVPGLNQVQTNDRAGMTFATALRSILRSDPDVIMIGEIRDSETAKIAVESAMTGHLVLSTLHTNSAAAAVTRLMEMGVEPFLIADACHMIMAQRLARVLCGFCREPREVDEAMLRAGRAPEWVMGAVAERGTLSMFKAHPGGCSRCRGTGYRGRIGVHEVLALDPDLKEMIMRNASVDEIHAAATRAGMASLRDDGYAKALSGDTSLEEVARVIS